MTILIFEDEPLAAEKLTAALHQLDPTHRVVAVLKSVESAVEWLSSHTHPELIISDIRLLDGLSFEIFQQVPTQVPVIFTTAYDEYAIRAFDVNSIDYLLKPIQQDKLAAALQKLASRVPATPALPYAELVTLLRDREVAYKSRFMVRIGQRIQAVPVEKIAYFYSESKLTYLVTLENRRYPMDVPLDEIDVQLDPHQFFKINRQYITSFAAIAEIHPYFKGRIKLKLTPDQPDEIVVSAERSPEFKKWLDQ